MRSVCKCLRALLLLATFASPTPRGRAEGAERAPRRAPRAEARSAAPDEGQSRWPSARASRVKAALLREGWSVKRTNGSHHILTKQGLRDYVFNFHDSAQIGPSMMKKIGQHTGLTPSSL